MKRSVFWHHLRCSVLPLLTDMETVLGYKVRYGTLRTHPDNEAILIYDPQTRSMLQTDQQFPGCGSQRKGLTVNPDSSVDVYFGPEPPEGLENKWVQTIPGKGFRIAFVSISRLSPGPTSPGCPGRSNWSNRWSKCLK